MLHTNPTYARYYPYLFWALPLPMLGTTPAYISVCGAGWGVNALTPSRTVWCGFRADAHTCALEPGPCPCFLRFPTDPKGAPADGPGLGTRLAGVWDPPAVKAGAGVYVCGAG